MLKSHKFTFSICGHTVPITVNDVSTQNYGGYLWPSAAILGRLICEHLDIFRSKTILELGSGIGLSGIVAAKAGCTVILSDTHTPSYILTNCKQNCALNQVERNTEVVSQFSPNENRLHYPGYT